MLVYKPTPGAPTVALVINKNLYNYGSFIGSTIVSPIQKQVPDFGKQLVSIAAFQLASGKKPTKKQLQPHIEELLEYLDTQGIDTLICANADYFNSLVKKAKFTDSIGTVKQCSVEGYEHIAVIPLLSPAIISQQPGKKPIVDKGIRTIISYLKGEYKEVKAEIETYKMLTDPVEIRELLEYLKGFDMVAWDIETSHLHFRKLEPITQAFAVSENEAYTIVQHPKYVGDDAEEIDGLLKDFFHTYEGTLLVHNYGFESKFLVWRYFMKSWDDYESLYKAVNKIKFDDTMLLAKAARNSVDRVPFGLKDLAAERFGDWDADIDVKKALSVPIEKLAFYNAVDVCATWFVWDMIHKEIRPEQLKFYHTIMKDVQRLFTKLMVTGLPISYSQVIKTEKQLKETLVALESKFYSNRYVLEAEEIIREILAEKYNATHKVKQKTPEDFADSKFNYNSVNHKRILLFDVLGYEPIAYSDDSGEPKTDKGTIAEYLGMETDEERREVLECLDGFSKVSIILNNFISTMREDSIQCEGDHYRLYGNLVVAGAISFRPTANSINLLNMPSGSTYGKLIKQCFKERDGYIIMSADYAALQNRTGCFLANAKNLIRILNEGIDSHAFHMARFFPDEIDDFEDTKEWYEMAKHKYKALRRRAKAPAFAMQYSCAPDKVQQLLKCSPEYAQQVYDAYHKELYPEISEFNERIGQIAEKEGIVHLGMGWYVHTQSASSKDNSIASKAKRSASNGAVQFWDILSILALRDFVERIENEGYIGKVIPHATIYDSVYCSVVDDVSVIEWANRNLTDCMTSAIKYMEEGLGRKSPVPLLADAEIGESWVPLVELPNTATQEEIEELTIKALLDKEFAKG